MGTHPKGEPDHKLEKQEQERTQETVRRLSEMVDLVEYQDFIGRKTRYGKKPGPEPWYYTKQLLATYAHKPQLETFTALFEAEGVANEVQAAKWVVINDDLTP